MSIGPTSPDIGVATKTREQEETRTKLLPPYNVILDNDEYHSFEFVMEVLRKVLGCTEQRAFQLTEEAHTKGRVIIWSGSKEVAEFKVEQVHTCHEMRGSKDLGPLSCSMEPAAG